MNIFSFCKILFVFCLVFQGDGFADDKITIRSNYWEGSGCLTDGVPWQVPASIYKEAENCRGDDMVLELGTGGSTIFFAKRCKFVTAIETNEAWAAKVKSQLDKLNLRNVELLCIKKQEDIELFLQKFNTADINIFSVDTAKGYSRSAFLNQFLRHGISQKLHMIVLDNYADKKVFPDHYDKDTGLSEGWEVYRYDDSHWSGNGTKLHIKKIR